MTYEQPGNEYEPSIRLSLEAPPNVKINNTLEDINLEALDHANFKNLIRLSEIEKMGSHHVTTVYITLAVLANGQTKRYRCETHNDKMHRHQDSINMQIATIRCETRDTHDDETQRQHYSSNI
ncbi:hypothetical protein ACLKA7_001952 [Drosophila subpalustris]